MEEFRAKASYLGGHPESTRMRVGELVLDADELKWMPKAGYDGDQDLVAAASRLVRRRPPDEPEPFTIDVSKITSAEFKGDAELKKTPSGYFTAIPGFAHGYGGGQARHPIGRGKLKKLLIVRYSDERGREHEVLFANVPDEFSMRGPLAHNSSDRGGYELVSKIMAARAKSAPSSKEAPALPAADSAARLRALAELHGEGLLTDEEFATKRRELLDAL